MQTLLSANQSARTILVNYKYVEKYVNMFIILRSFIGPRVSGPVQEGTVQRLLLPISQWGAS